jgi:hypothetical protein
MNKQFDKILQELHVEWFQAQEPGGEPWQQANITDTQLELYTRCVVKLCVDKILNMRVVTTEGSTDAEQFSQWNTAVYTAADEIYDLVSENQP